MTDRVVVQDGLLRCGDRAVPLIAGEIQFWRMDPHTWEPALRAAARNGITLVSTYLSWRRHEIAPGRYDFDGASDPRLNVRAFLQLCAEADLPVQLKPGPWICAEEPGGGYPDRLLTRTDLIARDDQDEPVVGYNPPFLHPVPSYAHPDYLTEVRKWFTAVWDSIRPYAYPHGPVIAMQLDNEPSSCFQDSMYGTDYSWPSIAAFRDWIRHRYDDDLDALACAWDSPQESFETVEPPRRPTGTHTPPGRQHDWITFKTEATADYLAALRRMHEDLGGEALLYTVNLVTHPVHDVPVSHQRIRVGTGAIVGEDHYYIPPLDTADIARLARSAATARAAGEPLPWIPELQSGIWRSPGEHVDYPEPTPREQEVWTGAAVALGFAGANFYMLADRENWEHAPYTVAGTPSPFITAIHPLVDLAERDHKALSSPPLASVHVAWHRPDAFAAYASVGTSRVPETTWADAGGTAAYRAWEQTLTALTAAGMVFDLWDTATPFTPRAKATLLVPPGCTVPEEKLDEVLADGHTVRRLHSNSASEVRLPAAPRIEVDGKRVSRTLVTIRPTPRGDLAHIVHWGSYKGPAVLRVPEATEPRTLDRVGYGVQVVELTPRSPV
ncbi:beta-galactosidase [Amnibacterium kyonggiense]|uniref:Glycosyl hydrolase family 35 n=1 Tax=Amnibacterium kyonggiense TaxID=595671 RepID=A0A4R7FR88_9MICO|nr:beta-galactosidase [Amnibacterium kyonggiense]TDS80320.1 glycosyl hydrolase family 35 [Amnibacterium kyonggiense]